MERDPGKARAWQQRAARAYAARQTPRRLAPRSAKMQAAYAGPDGRRALVARMLREWPVCQVQWACRGAAAVDLHERLKRSRGGSITDPAQSHAVTACRECHELTEREPYEATRRRMLLPSWHRCPPVGPC